MNYRIPDAILLAAEFFGPEYAKEGQLVGRVHVIFRDATSDQWCTFEMADMAGMFTIHLGSRFFEGFTTEVA
jgi:hypothetical protein